MANRLLSVLLLLALPVCAAISLKPAVTGEGKWPGGIFPDTSFEGVRYVSCRFLESLFGREGSWVPDRQKYLVADSSGKKWYFSLDNPYMNIGDEVYNLGFPVRRGPELLYFPLPPLLRILNARLGYSFAVPDKYAESGSESPAPRPMPIAAHHRGFNILGLGTEARDNGTLVSLRTAGKLAWESYWVPPHFILKFEKGSLAPDFPSKSQGEGLVKNILALQEKDLVQITLTIPKAVDTVEVAYSEESPGFLVTVRKKTEKLAGKLGADKLRGEKGKGTIIIDPGHGGRDQGAQVGGVNEAQVTLAVGLELKAALTQMGYKALLTRESDAFVSLQDRPKFASDKGGDLFISLHCNSITGSTKRKRIVSGFIAYILREGESEEDKALARRENQVITEESGKSKAEISPVEWILLEHQLNLYSKESESFVEQIIREFDGYSIGKYATGASQAGFYVLVGAYMPAVLFEMGYLTHDQDRRLLGSSKGQKQIADRLAKAIDKYRKSVQGK
jgi:N-acetylmuramoyl-L-alanine amidase